jgi:hypothetical protein
MCFTNIIFAREQKCMINHSGLAFYAGMVVTNTTFVLEKFFINVFPLKDFLNSLLKFPQARIVQIEKGTLDYRTDTLIVILDHFNLKINFFNKILISDLKKLFFSYLFMYGVSPTFPTKTTQGIN